MDGAYLSGLIGLAGAAIGGLSSFGTTWLSQRSKARETLRKESQAVRQTLYTEFISEASRLFGDAISHQREDVCNLVTLYVLVARMRLVASTPVVEAAQGVMNSIIAMYGSPKRSLHDLHLFHREGRLDPLLDFSETCREELIRIARSLK